MKKSTFIALFALAFAFVSAFSQIDQNKVNFTCGKQPTFMFNTSQGLNVICMGVDLDFNGSYTDGEEAPSWWRLPKADMDNYFKTNTLSGSASKICNFEFAGIKFPTRLAVSGDTLFVGLKDRIATYNTSSGALIDSIFIPIDAHAISVDGNRLYVSKRVIPTGAWLPDTNFVFVVDRDAKSILDTIPARMNVQMTIPYTFNGNRYLAIAAEGTGASDASVEIINLDMESDKVAIIEPGSLVNHISLNKDKSEMLITLNGSHKLVRYNLGNFQINGEIATNTSGFNGPRESIYGNSGLIFSTTYESNLAIFDNNSLISNVPLDGKAESVILLDESKNYLAISLVSQKENYTANDKVTLFNLISLGISSENDTKISVYPNPSSDFINISSEINADNYEIFDISGAKILSNQFDQNARIDIRNLAAGSYILFVKSSDNAIAAKVIVKQ